MSSCPRDGQRSYDSRSANGASRNSTADDENGERRATERSTPNRSLCTDDGVWDDCLKDGGPISVSADGRDASGNGNGNGNQTVIATTGSSSSSTTWW